MGSQDTPVPGELFGPCNKTDDLAKPGEPDLVIQVQPELMHQSYWTDPRPAQRTGKGRVLR
jgi:hypothetical protein